MVDVVDKGVVLGMEVVLCVKGESPYDSLCGVNVSTLFTLGERVNFSWNLSHLEDLGVGVSICGEQERSSQQEGTRYHSSKLFNTLG
jgi:hypothetical protein